MKICTSEQEYISAIVTPVQKVCKRYGYLPSVLIAQSCLENGYGIRSYWDNPQIQALLQANNMVGIKSELLNSSWANKTVWTGQSLTKDTPEEYGGRMVTIKDNFRKYDTIERSFADFLLFLTYASNSGKDGIPKYGESVLNIKDPETLIKKVSSLGYATGSTYPTSVMRIINKHNLTKYDNLSNITPTIYTPGYKGEETTPKTPTVKKLGTRKIYNIIARNKSQVPASRGNHEIKFIVCHYLGVPNADNPDLYGGGYGGHYNIQRNGEIYNAADPRSAVVWHCGGGLQGSEGHSFYKICTNYNSIGIECGVCYTENVKDADGDSSKWYFTEQTQQSLVYLVSKLMDEYNIPIDHVIRHYDVTGKTCLPLDNTEILTKNGWKWLSDVQEKEEIACYDSKTDEIIFDNIEGIVPTYTSEVISNRGLEATSDHRMWMKPNSKNSHSFREVEWGYVLEGHKSYIVKNGALSNFKGLDIEDDELRLLAWIQGDGSYMKDYRGYYGLEFHFSKERKIIRIKEILQSLGINYNENWCSNNTVHIRINTPFIINWAEKWLHNKAFTFKMLEMDNHQFHIFFNELLQIDGHNGENKKSYTSVQKENLDFIQALCATHGIRSKWLSMGNSKNNLSFAESNYTIGNSAKYNRNIIRTTEVSCIKVPTGYFLIRQNGNPFIVGNCPNPYVKNNNLKTSWTWNQFKNNLTQYRKDGTITIPNGSDSSKEQEQKPKNYLSIGDTGNAVKTLQTILNACGYPCGEVDGSFGSKTENALKQFQKDTGLSVDGKCGPASKSALTEKYNKIKKQASTIYLKIGDNGANVKKMQEMLIACGYSCGKAGADGDYGDVTAAAIKKFQQDKKLKVIKYGNCDLATKTALEELYNKVVKPANFS